MKAKTPMLQQYFAAKEAHPGVLLAMRVGDFYEFYGEDAVTAATALEITLTGREDGENGRIPMAGVPHHSVEKYLARLLQAGLKVALCDQLEDPKLAKGLVRRAVTRVLTPGTVLEDSMLQAAQNNFLVAISFVEGRAGLATLDPTTGEFLVTELEGEGLGERLLRELSRIRPAEVLLPEAWAEIGELAEKSLGTAVSPNDEPDLRTARRTVLGHLKVPNLQGFGCDDWGGAIVAAGMILGYAERNGLSLAHVDALTTYSVESFLGMDLSTRRSLELTQNLSDGSRRHTLLSVLDETVTPMGARMLRRWIEQPLLEERAIKARLDAVERLLGSGLVRSDLRDGLGRMRDIERLVSRVATGIAGPRDLAALLTSLRALPQLAEPLRKVGVGRIQELREMVADHGDLIRFLSGAIVEDPPHLIRDGGVIRDEFDLELAKLRDLARNGRTYIAELERKEREATGIASLKVGYTSVFGYFLEVGKAHAEKIPAHYIRKQTTASAERYITAELKDHESAVLTAQEKALALESELFHRLRMRVAEHAKSLLQSARALAEVDTLASLAEVASRRGYVKPEIAEENLFEVVAGRHAVVEATTGQFVPNDLHLGECSHDAKCSLVVLTGPNMSGKSTYLRQAALMALMAQVGSFVPAKSCRLGVFDRIFARIGAKDEIALGQSTFMVEMLESANILHNATERSLVILDEIGRGTSTYDGLAIAWAMVEHLAGVGCKTLFATHYHQLNAIAEQVSVVSNFRVNVQEVGDQIVWTHKVLPGGTDRSYGVHVARMAGVPSQVLRRASEVLRDLEEADTAPRAVGPGLQHMQLTLFEAEDPRVVRELRELDLNQLTPLEALRLLDTWQREVARES